MLKLAFHTKSIRQLCESQRYADRQLGLELARILRSRLADLRAAACVSDIVVGCPREVERVPHRHFAVDLTDGVRLVLCANHMVIPVLGDGSVDWSNVSRVKILGLEDNHA